MSILVELIALVGAGVCGGFISGMRECGEHKIRLPRSGRRIELGIAGDAIIGAAASVATYTVAIASRLIDPPTDPHGLLKVVSVGVVAGFAGIHLLSNISNRLIRDLKGVKEQVRYLETTEESLWIAERGDDLLRDRRYEAAEREFIEANRVDPNNERAVIGLAKVFRWTHRLERSVETLNDFIEKKPEASRAIYNRACYKLLLNQPSEALLDLERAINLDPYYSSYALTDPDFNNVRHDATFLAVVQGSADRGRKLFVSTSGENEV